MKHLHKAFTVIGLLTCFIAGAQEQPNDAEMEKKFRESVNKSIEKLDDYLKLEDWQIFYIDSIYFHDLYAMKDEIEVLQKQRMSNNEAYLRVSDKWNDKIYDAIQKVLNEEQWKKYLKMGEGKAKKERDKRAAERNKTE